MNSSPFLSIGHRGAAAYAKENTLSSIQTALEYHVDMVELDVRRTKDHHLVLGHDRYLHGLHGKLKINRHTLAELQHLSLEGGETIPTLKQALEFINSKALVNIDIKEVGYEAEVVELVRWLGMEDRVMFSSLDYHSLKAVKAINPQAFAVLSYPSPILTRVYEISYFKPFFNYVGSKKIAMSPINKTVKIFLPYQVRRMLNSHQIDALIIRTPFITPKLVDVIHQKELKLYSWPADNTKDIHKLKSLGVDGATSNRPDMFHGSSAT